MFKLYKKDELNFALVCILLYCLVTIPIRGNFGDDSFLMFMSLTLIAIFITIFVNKYKLFDKYGLSSFPKNPGKFLYFIPIWILTTGNLWKGFALSYSSFGQFWATLSMILIGYIEEIIFRGFLFKSMLSKYAVRKSIIVVSISFGMGHIVNLLAGQASVETVAQIVFAIAWGFMLTITFYKSKSLWPCIIAHSLVDAFSVYGLEATEMQWTYIIASIIISIFYCNYLLKIKEG